MKCLFAFVIAVALVRPTKSIDDVKPRSVKKKMKDKSSSTNFEKLKPVSVEEIKKALTDYIAARSDANGVYTYTDADRGNQKMALRFKKIHDPVRVMEQKGQYFACTDFEVEGQQGKLHDLDYWMVPTDNGLKVVRTKVHKDPRQKGKNWEKVPRYTFRGENIVPITQ